MSKFIVVNTSNGIIASTHSTAELANKSAKKLKDMSFVVETSQTVKKDDLWVDLSVIDDTEEFEVDQELAESIETESEQIKQYCILCGTENGGNKDCIICNISDDKTVSYAAKPEDSRCSWWSMIIPQDQQLDGNRINAPMLKRGADLELKQGDMIIDSEANHHRKNRGYTVLLGVCVDGAVLFIKPSAEIKKFIKENGGNDLMHESGDAAGCVRMAVWLRRQPDLKSALEQIVNA